MTTTIGGIALDNDMVWQDRFTYNTVNASVEYSINNNPIIQEFPLPTRGRLITLVSTESQGMQTQATVSALYALAAQAYATFGLAISSPNGSLDVTVRFRNEVDGGPVQFVPVQEYAGMHADTMYYKGTIYLMRL